MNHVQLINFFIKQRGFKRYLQIGTKTLDSNFSHINCETKFCVESGPDEASVKAADSFFSSNQKLFGLIFIDGYHTEKQSLKEIDQSLKILEPGGIILLHDCLPPDEWHQREPHQFKEGECWNGTVWKAVLRTFNKCPYYCKILETDWGCGIIDTSRDGNPPQMQLPPILNYKQHYELLTQFRISIAGYLRERVRVFYHLACMGNWKEVFAEQMLQLYRNGFREINLTVLGSVLEVEQAIAICKGYGCEPYIVFEHPDLTWFEKPALQAIEQYAQQHHGYVLYLHSKGVSSPADEGKAKWRRLMMHELVDKWEERMMQLPDYDIIGVNWRDMHSISHFCGNFWYASTQYLRTLVAVDHYYDHPRFQVWDAVSSKRLGCEFWIGSYQQKPRLLSLVCRNVDFCDPGYWMERSA